jgi:hypothetical protein
MELLIIELTAPRWPKWCRLLALLYGPAARCKPKVMIWRSWVCRFCIRPLNGTFVFLAIMDIRARSISFASRL